jgi:hypothetical protein
MGCQTRQKVEKSDHKRSPLIAHIRILAVIGLPINFICKLCAIRL